MRVCLVSQEYPPETASGGIGTQTWNKAHALQALGHTVYVLSCSAQRHEDLRTAVESGITVHRMRPPGERRDERLPIYDPSAYMVGYSWHVCRHLHELSGKQPFDLINFPEYSAEGYAYQLNRGPWNWTPVIVQLHGPLAMFTERIGWPARDSAHFRTARHMEGESIRMADGWMASSANIADFTAEYYGIPRDQIDVVHCGLDCAAFSPPESDAARDGERPTVLFVGNIAANKGIHTIFEAVLRLRSRFPGIRLQIAGRGDEQSEKLRRRAQREGAESCLELLGFVKDRSELPGLYRRAHVFASPADHEVGVANVYVEAMACGCPVIACNTGGAPEAVRDGETGFLVPPRDVAATTAALERLLADRALHARFAQAARRVAVEYFATERYIDRVLAAYAKTLARSQRKLTEMKAACGA